jgi:hypothetical protein
MVYRALILWSDEVRSCQVYEARLGSRNTRLTLMLFWCSVELSGDSLCREWRSPLCTIGLVAFYSIATVVDNFIDRIMVDPRLNANPRVGEAHHRVPPAGFQYL